VSRPPNDLELATQITKLIRLSRKLNEPGTRWRCSSSSRISSPPPYRSVPDERSHVREGIQTPGRADGNVTYWDIAKAQLQVDEGRKEKVYTTLLAFRPSASAGTCETLAFALTRSTTSLPTT
jgi:hypothetical protein